ncbi:MAG TPA: hypothetical protein VM049_11790 [Gaiellaceae bacterium]|nr:hypothetical protein [Gaiellaceae bacterium]
MPLYDAVKALELVIEEVQLEPHELPLKHFTRRTTVVHLLGGGAEGVGEDVTYDGEMQLAFTLDALPELTGVHTLKSFSSLVADQPGYRPWGLESAALDLALRQAGRSLAEAIGRTASPVRFVVSQSAIRELLELYPELRFKLDASDSWTDEVVAELAATGAVDVVDLKGLYEGDWLDATPSAELYRRVAEGFPGAWLEDARLDDETRSVLEPHRARLTWDFPIHSVADVESLAFPPQCLNSKPSRFGSVERLFDFYDYCAEHGIALYGGGQFELGPGRGQIQHLASLFHPDTPNDVAPKEYNEGGPRPGLPQSQLPPPSRAPGFR